MSDKILEAAQEALDNHKQALDAVYAERNQCVALIARMASIMGNRVGLRTSSDFEPGWQNCIMIDLPTGQVSWHLKDSELPLFNFPDYPDAWDGHSTQEKYRRVNEAYQIDAKTIIDLSIDAQQIIKDAELRTPLSDLAINLLQNTPDTELCLEHLQIKRDLEASQVPADPNTLYPDVLTTLPEQAAQAPVVPAFELPPYQGGPLHAPGTGRLNVFDHSVPED